MQLKGVKAAPKIDSYVLCLSFDLYTTKDSLLYDCMYNLRDLERMSKRVNEHQGDFHLKFKDV